MEEKRKYGRIGLIVVLLLIVFLALMAISNLSKINKGMNQTVFIEYLNQTIPKQMEKYKIPGTSFALIENNNIIWTQAYGVADQSTGRKMTIDTPCRVESISKSLTAAAVMHLAETGKIDIDQEATGYLKEWTLPKSPYAQEKMTIRQLLTHRSGLPLGDVFERYPPGVSRPSLEENLAQEARLIRAPGTSFGYSNVGYNLLELVIEKLTGQTYSIYMDKEIIKPLNMDHSTFEWKESMEHKLPIGYDLNSKAVQTYIYPAKASGGLFSTAEDIGVFISSHWMDYIDEPQVQDIGIYNLVFDAYAMGTYVEDLGEGIQAVSHGGQGGGVMTHYHFVPQTGDGIVILTNSQRSWPFIATILNDWARWNGYGKLGMYNILIGQKILWIIVFALWGLSFIRIKKAMHRKSPIVEIALAIVGIVVSLGILMQDYSFIKAVFPRVSIWLFGTVLLYGMSILAIRLKKAK